jgi:hypothetical protein
VTEIRRCASGALQVWRSVPDGTRLRTFKLWSNCPKRVGAQMELWSARRLVSPMMLAPRPRRVTHFEVRTHPSLRRSSWARANVCGDEVTRAALFSDLASDFDDFLFAPIREDKSGMPLSVVSALARLDVDPWEEAARLAAMPGEAATQRLSALIASLPAEPTTAPESRTTAARLIALLPQRSAIDAAQAKHARRTEAPRKSPAVAYAIYYVIFMLFILLSQWLIGSRQTPVTGEVSAPSLTTAPSSAPPRSSSP